jgi:broad specificity phosphatase PhoE
MVPVVAIFLVRHAHAGSRGAWAGDDAQRPLSPKGWRQSRHLVDVLDGVEVATVYASPARRCIETVTPVAEARGLEVIERGELFEGHNGKAAWALAVEHADENPVLCSHGDIIPTIISRLRTKGLRTLDDHLCAKGSVWTIELGRGGHVVAAEYHPPKS